MVQGWWGNSVHPKNGSSISGSKVTVLALIIFPPARREKSEGRAGPILSRANSKSDTGFTLLGENLGIWLLVAEETGKCSF